MAKRIRKRIHRYRPRFHRTRHKNRQMPLAPLIGIAATTIGDGAIFGHASSGAWGEVVNDLKWNLLGLHSDNQFSGADLVGHWLPTVAGVGVHFAANKLGVNRSIAKIPMIGKYIAL